MAEVKGKFITLAVSLMSLYPDAQELVDKELFENTGQHWTELEPEGWYDTKLFNSCMEKYAESSITGEVAIVTLGRNVYPLIKKSVGLPEGLDNALDLILFEAEGFMMNHQGSDVIARNFVKKETGHVIVKAPAPGYNQKLYEGVFMGILEMSGIKDGTVKMISGDPDFEYEIKWPV